jgi:hypothetical protein
LYGESPAVHPAEESVKLSVKEKTTGEANLFDPPIPEEEQPSSELSPAKFKSNVNCCGENFTPTIRSSGLRFKGS